MNSYNERVRLEVVSPISYDVTATSKKVANATRLDTLADKTICELTLTGSWRVEKTFPVIRELLKKRFPGMKFVTYDKFPYDAISTSERSRQHWADLERVGEALKTMGCDGLIVGNGG